MQVFLQMKSSLTIILTCSAIPSHPATSVVEQVINSMNKFCPSLLQCNWIITFDGFNIAESNKFKSMKLDKAAIENYHEFIKAFTRLLLARFELSDPEIIAETVQIGAISHGSCEISTYK